MSIRIRVVLADDHLVIRNGLRLMLATSAEEFALVGEAGDGAAALAVVEQAQPDVVLLDLRMPIMDGLTALGQIRVRWPEMGVVILTTYNEDDLMIRALQAGARGYLLKDCTLEELLQALRAAARGETLVQPAIMARLLTQAARAVAPAPLPPRGRLDLTERERAVLAGVARGERSKEIAMHLGIRERTVGSYLASIYAKLGVDSRAAAVAVALERGILPHG